MTLLIKGVHVLVGDRPTTDLVDVFISGDKISAVGNFPTKPADVTIDGDEAYLSPGFIDVHAETDHYLELFSYPIQDDFLKQGITTTIGGQEGTSLAPLIYGSLESFEEWASPEGVNIDWHTIKEFLSRLDEHPLGMNFGTLVGHSTVRRALIGGHLRALTKNEMAVFLRVLEESLTDGAFGMSVNLKSVYGRKTPYAELNRLATLVAKYHGFCSIGLRKATGLTEAVDEVVQLAKESGVTAVISNLLPIIGQRRDYELALEKIEGLSDDVRVRFDVSPFGASVRPLYRFLPDWVQSGSLDDMIKNLEEEWMKPRILKDLPPLKPDEFIIVKATHNDSLVGYSLREFMELYAIARPAEAMYKLMRITKLRALIGYHNVDQTLIGRALTHPRSFVASKGVSISRSSRSRMAKSDSSDHAFTKFLTFVTRHNLMSIESAVHKITAAMADFLHLPDRGRIGEGKLADLVGFRTRAGEFEIAFVVVGGRLVFGDGQALGLRAGRVLRHT